MPEPERLAAEAATDAMVVEAEAVVRYGRAAQARRAAMDAWMWSDATGCWHDSWLNVPPAQLEDTPHLPARCPHGPGRFYAPRGAA